MDSFIEYDGSRSKACACAVQHLGEYNDNNELCFEVYQSGATLEEAKENVIDYIEKCKVFKSRYIHFMDDD